MCFHVMFGFLVFMALFFIFNFCSLKSNMIALFSNHHPNTTYPSISNVYYTYCSDFSIVDLCISHRRTVSYTFVSSIICCMMCEDSSIVMHFGGFHRNSLCTISNQNNSEDNLNEEIELISSHHTTLMVIFPKQYISMQTPLTC